MNIRHSLLTIGALSLLLCSCSENRQSALYQELRSTDKLVLSSMAVTKAATVKSSDWYTVGKRIAVYSYNTYMQAYIDLSSLQEEDLEFDEENKTVRVTLPPIVTEIIGRDFDMKKEYENIAWSRDNFDAKERAEVKEKANADFKKEVEHNPVFKEQLTEAAKNKARSYFETIFEDNGYTAIIDFKSY